ncbi:hypothetical protein P5673_021311 [Acropora cervicornis]|uniref:Uncharacterized protein n=1 Tax=Acropora cervicornis TaxID=6130 RepID=A0AAD9Q8M6_ACRCE|nr:hypothetical protein P5673_021311 [Acropora cervicornis]
MGSDQEMRQKYFALQYSSVDENNSEPYGWRAYNKHCLEIVTVLYILFSRACHEMADDENFFLSSLSNQYGRHNVISLDPNGGKKQQQNR